MDRYNRWEENRAKQRLEEHNRKIAGRNAEMVKLRAAKVLAAELGDLAFVDKLDDEIKVLIEDNIEEGRTIILEATGATIGRRSF